MCINVSIDLLKLNSLQVPTSKAILTANTAIVLCVHQLEKCIMSVQTYYNRTADKYRPVYLQLQRRTPKILPAPVCFLCKECLQIPDPTHAAEVRQIQFQTDCSVHNLGAAQGLRPTKPLFYLTTIRRHLLFAPLPYYRSHTLSAAHMSGGLAAGNDKRKLSGKLWMQSVHDSCIGFGITALFLHYWPAVFVSQIFMFCFILCLQILLLCVSLSSGSVQLPYHRRPDLLSTLPLKTKPHIQC